MKRYLYTLLYIYAVLTGCYMFSACDKLPKNGDLDGMWQLLTIEHEGIITDVKDNQLYLSFQLDLFQLNQRSNNKFYYGYFHNDGKQIIFSQFSDMAEEHPDAPDNYPIDEDNIGIIEQWGYYALTDTFKIEYLTKNNMTLCSKHARITYRKF